MKTLYTLLLLITSTSLFAQIQGNGGLPTSTKLVLNDKVIQQWVYAQPDITALAAEDALIDEQGIAPWRFGFNNYTNLNTTNAGSWFDLPNGARLWLAKVKCEGALTVNLTFEQTSIPNGNKLFVYNASKDFILGAFTQEHIYDGQLGTELIPGEEAIIEYYVAPKNNQGFVQLATVTHGYRTANEFLEKAFGSSGSCNMNVNCPDGLPWTPQRNSAVMLVSGSSGFCSGALINNTQNDGKPYVLTANHCYSNPATWVFRFNWQAIDCANPGASPTFQSLSGAVLRSRRTPSDFCLVEITGGLVNGTVPLDYNPYFSGWDKSGNIPTATVSIHHPSGDIKKISFDDAAPSVSQGMGSSEANSTWTVEWDRNTTTEGGSSGSPLFDQNHRIIGQLWGGGASCQNLSAPDYYGRVSNSWEPAGSNSTNQLKFWLDPSNSGAAFIDGFDPNNTTVVALDAALSAAQLTAQALCGDNYLPSVSLMNVGTTVLTSAQISYQIDNGAVQQYNWSGTLNQWQAQTISLPLIQLAAGNHTFTATVSNPNQALDENTSNNQSVANLAVTAVPETIDILKITLTTDDYADETYVEVRNAAGAIIWSEGNEAISGNFGTGGFPAPTDPTTPLQNNTTYNYDIPLTAFECYTFVIYDFYGDGLGASQWGGTDGALSLANNNAVNIYTLPAADFGDSVATVVRHIDDVSIDEVAFNLTIAPNPASAELFINWYNDAQMHIQLFDVCGKQLLSLKQENSATTLDIQGFAAGTYLLQLTDTNGQVVKKKFVKQ
ncbi:MAG: T9SS type A sorting domain-containing protein [Crocinitomicaceae bacterium]|nr:T9SS type A sorting domain-containing protein [Crocinitomicaceae bacterium]MDP4722787.1 T9SS type A sorting domain-containing protein [Crocinitomicaceae bacterium]MDP4798733.1 T9SS type A sorting domain-containing protein [Crocinitomicaceae bacterium]MDP4807488.1 T9SS type A sorting domain-containing protein [Crocinitomicaceae bacterium]MDP5042033.1 T9SS type A sorting domain-containing protein [Crocinitomicaceae bacterium]